MATQLETYSYKEFKKALDSQYNLALANLALDAELSAGWIQVGHVRDAYHRVWQTVSYKTASKQRLAIGGMQRIVEDAWKNRVSRYVEDVAGYRIRDVWANSKKQYIQAVNDAIVTVSNEGLGVQQATTRIRSLVNKKLKGDINVWRARRIAQTELVSAGNYGSNQALIDAVSDGARLRKVWRASGRNTRDTHLEADGQIREVGKDYNIGGFPAEYPGDPRLPAEEAINCQCGSLPYTEEFNFIIY